MKINKVKFKNINSLKDEQEVDFENPKLIDAGLILITGPTGSGKSTILDVITLALYNTVPRFGKLSKEVITKQGSIITHNTKDAYAEVFYTVDNTKYVSKWSLAYNRNNNLNDYNMELWNVDTNTTLADKKGEIPEMNEKIIGLSYDQFIKSILLSQGEFAQFLRASHEDRSLLLEKITGTHIYREIGKLTFAKHKTAKENLDIEINALKHIEVKSEEEITNIKNEIVQLNEDSSNFSVKINALLDQKNKANTYNTIKSEIEDIKIKITGNENLKFSVAQNKSILEIHEKLVQHKDGLNRFLNAKTELKTKNIELEKLELRELRLKEELSKLLLESESVIKTSSNENNLLDNFTKFEIKYTALDNDLMKCTDEGKVIRNSVNTIASNIKVETIPWFKKEVTPQIAIANIDETLSEVNNYLSDNKITESTSITHFTNEINTINSNLIIYTEALRISKELVSVNKTIEENTSKIAVEKNAINKISSEIEAIEIKKKESNEQLIILQKEKDENFKRLDLEEKRKTLIDNEPCPLCGSLHHPYVEHDAIFSIGETEIKINEADKLLKSLTQEGNEKNKELVQSSSNISNWEQQVKQSEKRIIEINTQFTSLQNQGIIIDKIEENITALNEKQITNNKIVSALEKKNLLTPLREKYESLQNISDRYRIIQTEMKSLTEVEKPLEYLNNIKLKFISNQTEQKENALQLNGNKYAIETLQKVISESESKLLPLLNSIGINEAENAIANILSEETFVRIKSEIEKIETDGKTLESNLNLKTKELFNIEKETSGLPSIEIIEVELNSLNNKLKENRERTGVLNQIISTNEANKSKITNHQTQLNSLHKELRKWDLLKEAINADAIGKNYSNFAQELTLQQIIILANHRLTKLSDRYLLKVKNNDLFIIDLFQANVERSVKTLSGGESFIVSLALALSLSDLASQNIKLDCLFIDEGFGTLDSETLDIVISTLEKLQSESNKTIGIISHVDSLRDRIVTQIKLYKNQQGFSTIDIGFLE